MSRTVGVAELRQNLSRYLRKVEDGERLLVTDRNRPVAELGPPSTSGADLDRLIAEGRVSRPTRRGLDALQRPKFMRRLVGALHAIQGALAVAVAVEAADELAAVLMPQGERDVLQICV